MKRLLKGGPRVVSTGGGAFINDRTRRHIKKGGVSVWLKAELDVLWERVNKRDTRPLLKTENPEADARKPDERQISDLRAGRPHRHVARCAQGTDGRRSAEGRDRLSNRKCRLMTAIAASTDRKVHVPLGERAYDILIGPGLIARAGAEIASRLKGRKAAIIHRRERRPALSRRPGREPERRWHRIASLVLPAGEKTKSFEHLMTACDKVLEARIERNDS
jgi:hypothetical protein